MAKFNYKTGGNEVGSALIQVGGTGLAMIASNQLLDFRKVFKSMYEKNPGAGWIVHQGAVKAGIGTAGIFIHAAMTNKKMHPALRALLIGLILQGAFQEARVLTTGKDGSPSPIEALNGNGANLADLDELIRKAALNGDPGQYDHSTGIGNGNNNAGEQLNVDLLQNASSGIGFPFVLPQQFMR